MRVLSLLPRFWYLWLLLGMLAFSPMGIQQHGLDTAVPVGPFLNGALPPMAPGPKVGTWMLEEAFPHLSKLIKPLHVKQLPGTDTLWVAEKNGRILGFENDTAALYPYPVLDLLDITYTKVESGVLGFDFHPAYPDSNYVYVYYTYDSGNGIYDRLSRFEVDQQTYQAVRPSELVLINQLDRSFNHNAGSVFFDSDGFLYLSLGDEGGTNDQWNNGQLIDHRLFSGILRIDVDRDSSRSHPIRRQPVLLGPEDSSFTAHYFIPDDNPFLDSAGTVLEEFWAIGLRNPYMATFDSVTGQIWSGDVGQNDREEVNLIIKGGNYQWSYREGNMGGPFPMPNPLFGIDMPPVHEYSHQNGNNGVIGGYIYRGSQFPELQGKYLFADNGSGRVWAMTYDSLMGPLVEELCINAFGTNWQNISGFGRLANGELLVVRLNGTIYRLTKQQATGPWPPDSLSQTGLFTSLNPLVAADHVIPYEMRVPFWSDASYKYRWMVIPNDGSHDSPAEQIHYTNDSLWGFPVGAVLVKHLAYPMDDTNPSVIRQMETRLIVIDTTGHAYGLTYRWNDDQTDAYLIYEAQSDTIDIQAVAGTRSFTWFYPGPNDCASCHNDISKGILGPTTRQLNREAYYPQTGRLANQLTTLTHLGIFDSPPDTNDLGSLLVTYEPDDPTASLEDRARTYLDANCSSCHQPGTGIMAHFDTRLSTPLDSQGMLYEAGYTSLGLHDARLIVPGDLVHSTIFQRMNEVHDPAAMPPLAKNMIDSAGVALVAKWIAQMDPAYVAGGLTHQRVDFASLPNLKTTAAPLTLSASATSGLPVSYTLVSGPATLTDNQLTLTGGEGRVVLRAGQPGNATFAAAPTVERSFWVTDAGHVEGTGLTGQYFLGSDPSNGTLALTRVDSVLDFHWGSNRPTPNVGYDQFSVLWEGEIEPPVSGTYEFVLRADDGIRLWIDNVLVIDQWQDQAVSNFAVEVPLTAWQRVPIRIAYYERLVYAQTKLSWTIPGMRQEVVPMHFLYPANGTPLPVKDIVLTAQPEAAAVALRWTVPADVQADRYVIERTDAQQVFRELVAVQDRGQGDDTPYLVHDETPQAGLNYYRLRTQLLDGSTAYSNVVQARFELRTEILSIKLFSHPLLAGNQLRGHIHALPDWPIQVSLRNLRGQALRQATLPTGPEQRDLRLSTQGLSPGLYLLTVQQGTRQLTRKVLLR